MKQKSESMDTPKSYLLRYEATDYLGDNARSLKPYFRRCESLSEVEDNIHDLEQSPHIMNVQLMADF